METRSSKVLQSEAVRLLDEKNQIKKKNKTPLLPLIADIVVFCVFGLLVFTVFITLKLSRVVSWAWWWIFSPILFVVLILLILTQSKKLTSQFPLIVRLAWFFALLSMLAWLILLNLWLNDGPFYLRIETIFFPLWVFFGVCLILGLSGVISSFFKKVEKQKQKFLAAGIPLLGFLVVFFPFMLLLYLKITYEEHNYSWSVIFIPLWVCDGVFLCISSLLLLFTIGARNSATFSISQVATFVCVFPCSVAFKILLVLLLDGIIQISYPVLMIPIILVEILLIAVGLNISISSSRSPNNTHV